MAFLSKIGSILRQTGSNHMKSEISASTPSIFQAIRCMSSSKLFIGGLSYSTDEQSLKEAFGNYGEVVESRVIMDRETGRSRGFGFITYTSSEEASSAIQALDGQDLHGRRVRVNYATDRARTSGFGDGGYGGGGYGGGGGNYGGGGGNYGGGGGGNYGGGGGYNDGGYRGGGGGGDSFSGGGNFSSGGGDAYGNGSGNLGGGSSTFGVPGGAGGGDQFGSNTSSGLGDVSPLEGSFRDDDDVPDDFAKRA